MLFVLQNGRTGGQNRFCLEGKWVCVVGIGKMGSVGRFDPGGRR
jgi:hypothetical protein